MLLAKFLKQEQGSDGAGKQEGKQMPGAGKLSSSDDPKRI